ncbi:MAG: UDP-glucose dehydrogenase family protein [Gemmatimonadota bacterium]
MQITVIGTGYVGLVVGACLSEAGNHVACADIDAEKIERLNRGEVPIYEPGLDRLILNNLAAGRLHFTTRAAPEVARSEVVIVAVGTPPDADGGANLEHVLSAAKTVGQNLRPGTVVIIKSTVPVGTSERVRTEIERWTEAPFHLCQNPEFLKEGAAVDDFMYPDRVICGVEDERPVKLLEDLYEPFVRTGNPLIFMDIASAEMTKYAANSMLAARISFMNQIAELCEHTGADVSLVRRGVGTDRRIGPAFLFAGAGYGGSCFPKDVQALIRTGRELGVGLPLLEAVHEVNERQKRVLLRKIAGHFGEELTGRRFAVWGLAFKPETDDMRSAPSLTLVEGLLAAGAAVAVHDPVAMEAARALYLGEEVTYAEDEYAACAGADAMVLVTEWLQYRRPDWETVKTALRSPVVFDGRNLFDPERMRGIGFTYYSIGRGRVE